ASLAGPRGGRDPDLERHGGNLTAPRMACHRPFAVFEADSRAWRRTRLFAEVWRLPLIRGDVLEHDDAFLESLDFGELEVAFDFLGEELLAGAQRHRVNHEAIEVDQVLPHHRIEELGASRKQQILARLLLQLANLLGD